MKALLTLCLILSSLSWTYTQSLSSGIKFDETAWNEILQKAREDNKLIFVDAFTTWCGPCKKMSKNVFTNRRVADFYNKKFINVKMDMERGDGPGLATDYDVFVYPTLLFIDGNGTLVHRAAGYHDVGQFVSLGKVALDPDRRLSAQEDKYANGNREADFLYDFAYTKMEAYDGTHPEIADQYLKTQTDWSTDKNLELIFDMVNDAQSPMFDYLVDHKGQFERKYGPASVFAKIQQLIFHELDGGNTLEDLDRLFKKAYPERADEMSARFRVTYYRQARDAEKFAEAATYYAKKYKVKDADELNDLAWSFYELVDEPRQLKRAVKWAKKSVKQQDTYYNNDTLAALYYKLQKQKPGRLAAQRAIALARESGEDYAETQELLDRINAL